MNIFDLIAFGLIVAYYAVPLSIWIWGKYAGN